MEKKRNMKKIVFGCVAVVTAVVVMSLLYNQFKPSTVEGSKKIIAEVISADGTSKSYDIHTDEEYLRKALEQDTLIIGTESEYGLFVATVDGITADEAKKEWWCFTLGHEAINTSVDLTPIKDGDHFEITLTTGW